MTRNSRPVLVVLILFVLFFALVSIAAAAWTPWSCKWTVVSYPVTGGTLSGRGCVQWWDGAELLWKVWGDTYTPQSYVISTRVDGYDTCDGGAHWVYQMSTGYYNNYNTTYGTTGSGKQGAYQNCMSGHIYRADGSHFRKQTSSSGWEGRWGTVYW